MLMVALLCWVLGYDAREMRNNQKMVSEGTDADGDASVVGSRSVGHDMPRDPPPCASMPCKNRAECVEEGKSYQCLCAAGHFGRQCKDEDPCWSSPCQNQGKCIMLDREYKCKCQPHSTGSNCENSTPSPVHCTNTYCQQGGVCKISDGQLICVCADGYFGHRCQLAGNVINTNKTSNASEAIPFRRRQHDRSVYDILMLDIAVVGAMSIGFSFMMCVCIVCECKPRSPGQEAKEEDECIFNRFFKTKGTEKTKLLTKRP